MRPVTTTLAGFGLAAVAAVAPAAAQNVYADYAVCRQYAEQAVAPYLNQANAQGVGSALVGAGLGAALGAAVGGGRGAGIGAAGGALAGTGVGAANAQVASGQIQQMYDSYYNTCMQSRQGYSQPYGAPAYAPQPAYTYPPYGYPR